MTVSSSTSKDLYTGNGALTIFPYTFRILADTEIRVTVDDIDQTITTDYTVSGVGDAGGGNITFVTAPANLASIVLIRDMPFIQGVDYQENDNFPAETHETALDRRTMEIQQVKEAQDRALTIGEDQTSDTTFPDFEANKYVKVNGAGTALELDTISSPNGLLNIVEDLTPQSGGTFDNNGNNSQFDDNTGIQDDSGNEQLIFQKTASAINHLEVTNAAIGNGPILGAAGDDTDVDVNITPKGTGVTNLNSATNVTGNVDVTGTVTADVTITVEGSAASAGKVVLGEDTDNGSNTVTLSAPDAIASNVEFKVPGADGAANDVLITDGAGVLSLTDAKNLATSTKASVGFNGTGTIAIRGSHRVTSLTDNGTGNYTVNLTDTFNSTDDMQPVGSASRTDITQAASVKTQATTTTAVGVHVEDTAGTGIDPEFVYVHVTGVLA